MLLAIAIVVAGAGVAGLGHLARPGGRRAQPLRTLGAGLGGAVAGALSAVAVLGRSHRMGALELAVLVAALGVFCVQRYAGAGR